MEEVLGELLGYGAASPSLVFPQHYRLEHHAHKPLGIDARVAVEAGILGAYEGIHQRGGQLIAPHEGAVLDEEAPQRLMVVSEDLARQAALGILKLLECRHRAESPRRYEQEEQQPQEDEAAEYPPKYQHKPTQTSPHTCHRRLNRYSAPCGKRSTNAAKVVFL